MLTMFVKSLGVILMLTWVIRDHYFGPWLLLPLFLFGFKFTVKEFGLERWL